MKRYFPVVAALCETLGTTPDALNKPGRISISTVLLRHLIKCAITDFEIDPEIYREQNPDLATAYQNRPSGELEAHYKSVGYFEQRPLPIAFDAGYYVERYQDIKSAVKQRKIANPLTHFNETGVFELRSPRRDLEDVVAEWKAILSVSRGIVKGMEKV